MLFLFLVFVVVGVWVGGGVGGGGVGSGAGDGAGRGLRGHVYWTTALVYGDSCEMVAEKNMRRWWGVRVGGGRVTGFVHGGSRMIIDP